MKGRRRRQEAGGRYLDACFLRAAQRAFIISESFLRPAAEMPPRCLAVLLVVSAFDEAKGVLAPEESPRDRAQRALAAAESFARAAADICLRRLDDPLEEPGAEEVEPVVPANREERRRSRISICSRIPTASFSAASDRFITLQWTAPEPRRQALC